MERLETARSLRASAARLRLVAAKESGLSTDLLRIAEEIERDAMVLERAFREKPPSPANDENAA